MTILSVVRDVCAVIGVTQPTSVFSGLTANRTMQEILALANEMAQRIAYDTRDWTALRKVMTFAGDGVADAFNLPADYKRMLLTSNVYLSSGGPTPLRFIPDTDEWMRRRASSSAAYPFGEWTMLGGKIQIFPVMAVGQTCFCAYMNKNCVALNGGGYGSAFVDDGDGFVLDERLLKLGMIWQWKAQKGSPYVEDMSTYSDAMAMAQGADAPAPVIIGRPRITGVTNYAYR